MLDGLLGLFRGRAASAPPLRPPPPPPAVRLGLPARPDPEEMIAPIGASARRASPWPEEWRRQPEPVAVEPEPVVETPAIAEPEPSDPLADMTCIIRYVDAWDDESTRRITIKLVDRRPYAVMIEAFCHERNAMRTFRLDRVQDCWDWRTGEVIDLAELIDSVVPPLPPVERPRRDYRSRREPRQPATSITGPNDAVIDLKLTVPEGFRMPAPQDDRSEIQPRAAARVAMVERCGDGLRVLRFLALCDGEVHRFEEAAERGFARAMCEGAAVGLPRILCEEDFLERFSRRLRPTPESMLQAFGNMIARANPAEIKLLLEYANALIRLDGQVTKEEAHFAAELSRILRELPDIAP